MVELGPIEVGEVKAVRFNFSGEAAGTATLLTPVVTCTVIKGTDPNPDNVLVSTPTIDGMFVVQLIQAGVVGCTYRIRALVSDTSGLRHGITEQVRVTNG